MFLLFTSVSQVQSKIYILERYRSDSIKLNISYPILYTKRNQTQNLILLSSCTSFGKMSDVPTRNYIAHLIEVLEDQVQPLSTSKKYYVEFLRAAAEAIEKRRYPRVIVKLFKEIKKGDDPRGLKTGELAYALNMAWSPTGRIIIRKTVDPKISIIRFSNAADFDAAIYSIPNRVHGKLLSMRVFNIDIKVEEVDFTAQDYWVRFNLRGDLVEKGFVAKHVTCKIGRVLNLIGPLNPQGEYQAHVIADTSKALVHEVKIIILDNYKVHEIADKETIKLRILYMEIPHGTCRKCWFVDGDHSEEKCRAKIIASKNIFPKVYVYNGYEEVSTVPVQDTDVAVLVNAATCLQIYESEIDRVEYQSRGTKGRRTRQEHIE